MSEKSGVRGIWHATRARRLSRFRRWLIGPLGVAGMLLAVVIALPASAYAYYTYRDATSPDNVFYISGVDTTIYGGIAYSCCYTKVRTKQRISEWPYYVVKHEATSYQAVWLNHEQYPVTNARSDCEWYQAQGGTSPLDCEYEH